MWNRKLTICLVSLLLSFDAEACRPASTPPSSPTPSPPPPPTNPPVESTSTEEIVQTTPSFPGDPCGPEECGLTCKAGSTCVEVPNQVGNCAIDTFCFCDDDDPTPCTCYCSFWSCDNAVRKEGETCGFSVAEPHFNGNCEKNLTCEYDDPYDSCPTGNCIKTRKKEGESCGSTGSAPCEESLSCVHDSNVTDAPGICKDKQEGDSCGLSYYGYYGVCDEGLTCVSNPIVDLPGTCKIPEKKEGESCGYTGSGECEQGLSCVHDSNVTDASGICGKKQEGESCGKNNEGECDNGLTCLPNPWNRNSSGQCKKADRKEGESCGFNTRGKCEQGQGLSCVYEYNMKPYIPGICKTKQEGESWCSCFCPPKNNEGECDNGLTCVPNSPDVDDKGTCVKN